MQEIVRGVWQLSGFPRDMFNVYLVEDVLIDAATRWAKSRIVRQIGDRPLKMVALTHCHPDHQGVAGAMCRQRNIPLACHEADVPAMEGRAKMVPENTIMRLGEIFWAGSPHKVDRVLQEGDEVAGFRVVHAPGHTPGHVMFFRESDRTVIAGDVLANIHFLTFEPGLRPPPPFLCVDAAENRRSIRKLIELEPAVVCFGHGPPLREPELLSRFAASEEKGSGTFNRNGPERAAH